jgi:hypothetical protein
MKWHKKGSSALFDGDSNEVKNTSYTSDISLGIGLIMSYLLAIGSIYGSM